MEGFEEWNGGVRGAWSGPAGREGSMGTLSELGVTCDLGAMMSDLGRGHLSVLERSERSLE